MNIPTFLSIVAQFGQDLWTAWSTPLLAVGVIFTVVFFGTKMFNTARANAQVRADRAARDAYLAPVIDITHRLPARDVHGNIA